MLKKIILILFFLITHILSAQKEFTFNYVAEFKIYDNEFGNTLTDDHCLRYDFINSLDSSYLLYAFVNEKMIRLKLVLDNGISYQSEMPYDDFFVTHIELKCPKSRQKDNILYEKLNNFEFAAEENIIFNGKSFECFILKKLKRKKGDTTSNDHYVIDNAIGFNHPVLFPTEVLYRKWKKGEHLPNGLIKEIFAYNDKNEKTLFFELVKFASTEKHIIIDYTKCND